MSVHEAVQLGKILWSSSDVIFVDFRVDYGGLCTIWNKSEVSSEFTFNTQHWILTKFRSRQLNKLFVVIDVYMPTNPMEKFVCWRSLQSLKDNEFFVDCILTGDINVIRNSAEKKRMVFLRESIP